MVNKTIPAGLDLGNTWVKVTITNPATGNPCNSKIPARYASSAPPGQISKVSGQEMKAKAFSLLFGDTRQPHQLWFGQDVLGISGTWKLDQAKWDAAHIKILFAGILYHWSTQHRVPLSDLGKLNVVTSMPPGLFQKMAESKKAFAAFNAVFGGNKQSHIQIRDGGATSQIVTQFGGLQPEAIPFGQDLPKNGYLMVIDIGGGTVDYVLFNGSLQPEATISMNTGLIHAYQRVNPSSIGKAELKILRDKGEKLPRPLGEFFNQVEINAQIISRELGRPLQRIHVIGGGGPLMPKSARLALQALAQDKATFKRDSFTNSEANWEKASEK